MPRSTKGVIGKAGDQAVGDRAASSMLELLARRCLTETPSETSLLGQDLWSRCQLGMELPSPNPPSEAGRGSQAEPLSSSQGIWCSLLQGEASQIP